MINPLKSITIKKCKPDMSLLAAWGIPCAVMLFLFFLNNIFPFGDRSFLSSDMYHQYMPFLREFVEKVKNGENLFYSWNVGIGTNFYALYVYYLASPLNWLALLIPEAYLVEFMSYLVIMKIGLCGLTFCIYLRGHFRIKSMNMLFFSCFYALSGYMAAYNFNIMWLDCVILLPVILLGLERLVKENKCTLYCVTLALCILANYYISIMVCIFLVLYFITLLLSGEQFLKPIRNFALYSLLAGGMAAVLLVPEVCAIAGGDFGTMNFPKELESYFSILDELARHCMSITTERELDHWPNIYCGAAVLMLIPMYAVNSNISIKRRFSMLALAGFLLLSFATNILDFVWHGFNYPNSFPARQSFIYIWLVLVMCYEVFLHIRETEGKQILYGFLTAVVFLLFCEKFVESEDFDVWTEVLTLTFVIIYAFLLYYYRQHREQNWQRPLGIIALSVIILESGINMYNTSIGTVSRSAYLNQIDEYQELYTYAKEETDGFFRVEKLERKTKNDGTLAGYPTASTFSSTINSKVVDFYERLGMRHSKVFYGYDGATGLTSALLNVQYVFGDTEDAHQNEVPDGEDSMYTAVKESGGITLYECNYTLPFGYVVPADFEIPENKVGETLRLQNNILERLGIKKDLFIKEDCDKKGDNVEFKADQAGYYYAQMTASGTTKVDVTGSFGTKSFKDLKYKGIIDVGYLSAGQTITFSNANEEDETPEVKLAVYRMDTEVLKKALDKLSGQHMTDVSYDSTRISGHISVKEAGKLVLSVPYEEGWKILVNGVETEPGLLGDCLMTVELEPGEFDIFLEYEPKGRDVGLGLSLLSLALFVGISVFQWIKLQKTKIVN